MSWAPYVHPSGEYIVFASNKLGFENFEVFMVDVARTKEPVRITYADGFDGLPVPSPDGRRLAWTSSRGGGREGQIFLADWNHEAALAALQAAPRHARRRSRRRLRRSRRMHDATRNSCSSPRMALLVASPPTGRAGRDDSARRAHVELLASRQLEGREAGSRGERLAADYLVTQLTRIGARPLPGRSDMLHAVRVHGRQPRWRLASHADRSGARTFIGAPDDVRALSFSDDAEVTGPVVFAGYGLVVPESQNFGYDSYAGLDVKDKIVVVLRYFPEDADEKTRAILARYADLRYKAMAARQRGARAMLVVTGPRSPNAGELVPMTFDTALAGLGHSRRQHQRRRRRCVVRDGQAAARSPAGARLRQSARGRVRAPWRLASH